MFRGKEILLYQGEDPARNRYLLSYPSSLDLLDLGQDEEVMWRTEESMQFLVEPQDSLIESLTTKVKSRPEHLWVALVNIIILIIAFMSSPSTNDESGGCDINQAILSNFTETTTLPLSGSAFALEEFGDAYYAMS